jgi:hypothetical protein
VQPPERTSVAASASALSSIVALFVDGEHSYLTRAPLRLIVRIYGRRVFGKLVALARLDRTLYSTLRSAVLITV